MSVKDTYFRRVINWMHGDSAYLNELPIKDIGEKHINELLGRHPYYPFDPEMGLSHPCYEANYIFFQCMEADHVDGYELYEKHNACYYPYKTDLMKCLAHEKRKIREAREALRRQTLNSSSNSNNNNSSNNNSNSDM